MYTLSSEGSFQRESENGKILVSIRIKKLDDEDESFYACIGIRVFWVIYIFYEYLIRLWNKRYTLFKLVIEIEPANIYKISFNFGSSRPDGKQKMTESL